MIRISVILADDHPAVLAGIRGALEEAPDIQVLGCAGRGDEAMHLIETLNPEVALLDYRLPGLDGPAVARAIGAAGLPTRVLVLSAYASDAYVHSMLTAGASGYLLKDEALEVVVEAVRAVAAGEPWFSSSVEKQVRSWVECRSPQPPDIANLTPREHEVLRLVAYGWDNARVADTLCITEGTVKQHVCSIYAKLNVRSRAEAVAWAWQQNLMTE
jgi:DNA-binding NarL/FixJ family response regulator